MPFSSACRRSYIQIDSYTGHVFSLKKGRSRTVQTPACTRLYPRCPAPNPQVLAGSHDSPAFVGPSAPTLAAARMGTASSLVTLAILKYAAEAEVVREIFARFVAGETPRTIASSLNLRHVAAARGTHWNASTINGDRARGSGILHNRLYAGQLVWNRVRMIKAPATAKRVSRVNPVDEQRVTPVPHCGSSTKTHGRARKR